MAAKHTKPWEEKWTVVDNLSGGGQGTTVIVKRREGSDLQQYVLKVLKQQDAPDRRRRMYLEVVSLRILSDRGVPHLVESNVDRYDELSEGLYLVTEYIEGPTLEQFAQGKPIELSIAIKIVARLAEILEYTHANEVVHRDCKEDNIVLRHANPGDPVLLDYGLSFNKEGSIAGQPTEPGEQLGNRALALPELQLPSDYRRDPRADVTQCCGVFLQLLTGVPPVSLVDNHNLKPHQRQPASTILRSLPEAEQAWLIPLFDRAFELHLDRRVQSAAQLRYFLNQRNIPPSQAEAIKGKLVSVRAALHAQDDLMDRVNAQNLLQSVMENASIAIANVRKELGEHWGNIQTDFDLNMTGLRIRNGLGLYHEWYPERRFIVRVEGRIDGKELIATASYDGQKVDLLRASLQGPKDWVRLRDELEKIFAEGLDKLFSS